MPVFSGLELALAWGPSEGSPDFPACAPWSLSGQTMPREVQGVMAGPGMRTRGCPSLGSAFCAVTSQNESGARLTLNSLCVSVS